MFSFTLRSALFALVAPAVAVNAAHRISLKITGPGSVDTIENLKITAKVTNNGDETIKLLNDPLSPLSTLPANVFHIYGGAVGSSPSFIGVKAKYVPAVAAAIKAYTVLAPGGSVQVEHDLSAAYNFSAAGEGEYSFEARNLFHIVDDSEKITPTYAQTDAHITRIYGKLAVTRPNIERRADYIGCSSSQQDLLVSAASAAQDYAADALSYLQSNSGETPRYTTWFGNLTSPRHDIVQSHFSAISGGSFSSFTYDCTCTRSNVFAYVYPDEYGRIYLCGAFWSAPMTGTDSKGGTLVHECSHFTKNGGTDDHAYGQRNCRSLARRNPDAAVNNADSHEYFAENNPAQS